MACVLVFVFFTVCQAESLSLWQSLFSIYIRFFILYYARIRPLCVDYARGVYKLFDQETSRAEIISTVVNPDVPDTITVTWRLSGSVSIGPGLTIKPYICYTDFTVNDDGLIALQEDRFDIPGWDILLSALFPFLIGKITSPPAPPVPPREEVTSTNEKTGSSPLDALLNAFNK